MSIMKVVINVVAGLMVGAGSVWGAEPGLPDADLRLTDIRKIETPYTFVAPVSKADWLARAADLRLHMLVSTGLYPLPVKTPLHAQIFGRIEHEDYTVEKVYFESYPGFFCTGNLYRPKNQPGPFPGILNPHCHWNAGRFGNEAAGSVPGRCITQARLGFVAFTYDMVAYNDSLQVPDHRKFALPNTPEGQRLNLWGISMMGLQTWNSLRAIDFLQALPDVDPQRIGCTGESGGGTQTYMVTALDERIRAASPVNMVSGHYQGGCLCENGPGLRTHTNNMELTALIAPRPLFLVSCTGDWTKNTPRVEFPSIQRVYKLLGVSDHVSWMQQKADHNYNQPSREAVYGFLAHTLTPHHKADPISEPPFALEKLDDLRVFPDKKLPPNAGSPDDLCRYLIAQSESQLEALKPQTPASLKIFCTTYGPALRHALSVEIPRATEIIATPRDSMGHFFLQYKGARIPAVLFSSEKIGVAGVKPVAGNSVAERASARLLRGSQTALSSPATLIVHSGGKDAALALAQSLRQRGHLVLTIDCFLTGESVGERKPVEFFSTYNRTDTAERVQDILTALAFLKNRRDVGDVHLIGLDQAGLWSLLAYGLSPDVASAEIDAAQFDNQSDEAFVKTLFSPSLRRAGDLRTAVALAAPRPLFLHNTGNTFQTQWLTDMYRAAQSESNLSIEKSLANENQLVEWLVPPSQNRKSR